MIRVGQVCQHDAIDGSHAHVVQDNAEGNNGPRQPVAEADASEDGADGDQRDEETEAPESDLGLVHTLVATGQEQDQPVTQGPADNAADGDADDPGHAHEANLSRVEVVGGRPHVRRNGSRHDVVQRHEDAIHEGRVCHGGNRGEENERLVHVAEEGSKARVARGPRRQGQLLPIRLLRDVRIDLDAVEVRRAASLIYRGLGVNCIEAILVGIVGGLVVEGRGCLG